MQINKYLHRCWYWVFVSFVAFSAVTPKAAGAALVFILLAGLYSAFECGQKCYVLRRRPFNQAILIQIGLVFLGNLLIVLMHGDPLDELTTEIKFVLVASATYVIFEKAAKFVPKMEATYIAMAITCASAFAVVIYSKSRFDLPANPIPWAAGVGFVSLVLAVRGVFSLNVGGISRFALLFSALLGAGAVFLSQSRGTYASVIGVLAAISFYVYRSSFKIFLLCIFVAAAIFSVGDGGGYIHDATKNVIKAVEEGRLALDVGITAPEVATTSVGSRLYLWSEAIDAIKDSPYIGVGREGRIKLIRSAGDKVGLKGVRTLGHLHNQYINILVDRGILGLLLFLYLPILFVWFAIYGYQAKFEVWQRIAVISLIAAHMVASFFNVNYGHNYYGTMLCVCFFIVALDFAISD